MFSYLRQHRRTPSNPPSPLPPDLTHSWEPPSSDAHPSPHSKDANIPTARPQSASASANSLSILPPVDRVLSFSSSSDSRNEAPDLEIRQSGLPKAKSQSPEPPTIDFQQRGQNQATKRSEAAGGAGISRYTGQVTSRQTSFPIEQASARRPSTGPLPFVTAADLQSSFAVSGRKATGVRMSTPPPAPPIIPVSRFEGTQQRAGKRLNLLNPMSLLARRRTSQPAPQLAPIQNTPNPKVQDGFDPRIRGTKVHDFSAPRPGRNMPYNDVHDLENSDPAKLRLQQYSGGQYVESNAKVVEEPQLSPWSGGKYTPVFTEDFEEEQYPASGPHVRKANDVLDLPLPKPPYAKGSAKPREISKWAKNVDASLPSAENTEKQSSTQPLVASSTDFQGSDFPRKIAIHEDSTLDSSQTSRKSSSSTLKTRSRHLSDVSFSDGAFYPVPKHMKSTSSRFSFDMLGAAGQEKLLEDRHRQRALEKKAASGQVVDQNNDDDFEREDNYDYDDMGDDDGLEERIPGVNAEADDDGPEDEVALGSNGMSGFTFHPMNISTSTSPVDPLSPGTVVTPRDTNGEVIGCAVTKESPYLNRDGSPEHSSPLRKQILETKGDQKFPTDLQPSGLGLHGADAEEYKVESVSSALAPSTLSRPSDADDDLYFDDGLIDHIDEEVDGQEFDESVFDNDDTDEHGRPLPALSSLPTLYSPPMISDSQPAQTGGNSNLDSSSPSHEAFDQGPRSKFQSIDDNMFTLDINGLEQEKTADAPADVRQAASLTHDTLNAYQSALAAAAHKAAANGRFRRYSTPAAEFDERLEIDLAENMRPLYSPDIKDDFDYDDGLEDDLIIAEANAEALANDNDGFYGQEFGFYSVPSTGEAQAVNGGYFGPPGADGLNRSQSGRATQHEPNLTPITERSEYSNRNSTMSTGFGYGSVPPSATLSSPGLAQIAGMIGDRDDDKISFDALMKLRRDAWGSSQVSGPSSTAGGSPLSTVPVEEPSPSPSSTLLQWSQPPPIGHVRQNSNLSLGEGVRSEASHPSSPSLTMAKMNSSSHVQTSHLVPSAPPAPSPSLIASFNQRAPLSPASNILSAVGIMSPTNESFDKDNGFVPGRVEVKRHRHTGSSDSISYTKEDDPVTGQRWVLERKRMSETGEMEILGREILGGHI